MSTLPSAVRIELIHDRSVMYNSNVNQEFSNGTSRAIDGVVVHISGSGPDLVLLHANGGDHRDYDAIVDGLSKSWKVHRVDWPGHGESEVAPTASVWQFAELLPVLLTQLPGGPFVLIGNSVGGFAAIHTAAQRPDLVKGIVLVQPGGFTPNSLLSRAVCRLIGSQKLSAHAMRILPRVYLRNRTEATVAIQLRAKKAATNPESVRTFRSIWISFTEPRHDSRDNAKKIDVPTLLVWGTRDPILPWLIDGRRARKAFPLAEVVRFRCGHQAFAEVPDQFLENLGRFAERHLLLPS
jgi:pimeloyl-ACP methyl ester carboxylesterase